MYNIMPDVISRLSDPDVGVPEDNFQTIMKYVVMAIVESRRPPSECWVHVDVTCVT